MNEIDQVFIRSVETAVGNSMRQNIPLFVYICDNEDNSWVNELLSNDTLQLMKDKSICLKLIKGTIECQMFEQFFDKLVVPSVYCIKASVIWDILQGDITKSGFDDRINSVINGVRHPEAQTTAVITPSDQPSHSSTPQPPANEPNQPSTPPAGSAATKKEPVKREYKTLKEQSAEIAAKIYKEEQLKNARLAREEKERIKRLLKADEEERKSQNKRNTEERERQRRLSNHEEEFDVEHCIDEIILENKSLRDNIHKRAPSSSHDLCALSIRLLNGTSLKHSFLVTNTLNDVREYVDANRTDGEEPYCFHRTIPRTTFGVTDEENTLESLELTPRSALILKPFHKYTKALNTNEQAGIFSRLYTGISSYWNRGQTNEPDPESTSTSTSQYTSPLHSPSFANNELESHPSALNLNFNPNEINIPQRPHTPISTEPLSRNQSPNLSRASSNLATFRTLNTSNDDRTTYNGNRINLEDDNKK